MKINKTEFDISIVEQFHRAPEKTKYDGDEYIPEDLALTKYLVAIKEVKRMIKKQGLKAELCFDSHMDYCRDRRLVYPEYSQKFNLSAQSTNLKGRKRNQHVLSALLQYLDYRLYGRGAGYFEMTIPSSQTCLSDRIIEKMNQTNQPLEESVFDAIRKNVGSIESKTMYCYAVTLLGEEP
jgi:hypothetical protein